MSGRNIQIIEMHQCNKSAQLNVYFYTLFFYKNIFYKNIEAAICEILRILQE